MRYNLHLRGMAFAELSKVLLLSVRLQQFLCKVRRMWWKYKNEPRISVFAQNATNITQLTKKLHGKIHALHHGLLNLPKTKKKFNMGSLDHPSYKNFTPS